MQTRIAANPSAFCDLVQQGAGILFLERLASGHRTRPPFPPVGRRLHEFVAHPDGEIFILIHDAAVSIAVVRSVITLFDQRPSLLLFFLLGINEFLDVPMPIAQRIHFGGAACFAAGFHDIGHLIIYFEE